MITATVPPVITHPVIIVRTTNARGHVPSRVAAAVTVIITVRDPARADATDWWMKDGRKGLWAAKNIYPLQKISTYLNYIGLMLRLSTTYEGMILLSNCPFAATGMLFAKDRVLGEECME